MMRGDVGRDATPEGETAVGRVPEVSSEAHPRVGALRGGALEAGERPRRHARRSGRDVHDEAEVVSDMLMFSSASIRAARHGSVCRLVTRFLANRFIDPSVNPIHHSA
jgi:hypothetical protein